jgi:hypothetical protein
MASDVLVTVLVRCSLDADFGGGIGDRRSAMVSVHELGLEPVTEPCHRRQRSCRSLGRGARRAGERRGAPPCRSGQVMSGQVGPSPSASEQRGR